jgi:hypothetical protein
MSGVSFKLNIMTESLKADFCKGNAANRPKKKADALFGAAQQVKTCWA